MELKFRKLISSPIILNTALLASVVGAVYDNIQNKEKEKSVLEAPKEKVQPTKKVDRAFLADPKNWEHHSGVFESLIQDPFFYAIAQIESFGGKRFNHVPVNTKFHKGASAIGHFGLMPKTAHDYVRRVPSLKKKYGDVLLKYDPDKDHLEISEEIRKNPIMHRDILLAKKAELNRNFSTDEEKAYAWKNGITSTLNADMDKILNHGYVKEFLKHKNNFYGQK